MKSRLSVLRFEPLPPVRSPRIAVADRP
jgi:hypothetical protein